MPSEKELFAELRYRRNVQPDGSVEYYNEAGLLHREDGPAIIYASGSKHWCINGQLHREDGPAIEAASGDRYWYRNGKLHREDGPAVIYQNGTRKWLLNGMPHRPTARPGAGRGGAADQRASLGNRQQKD